MITINFDPKQFEEILERYELTPQKTNRAMNLALGETVRFIKSQAVKDLSGETKIPQKIFRKRIYSRIVKSAGGRISFYLRPFNIIRLGAKQNKFGVTTPVMSVRSAFITNIKGTELVFKRVGRPRLPIKPEKIDFSRQMSAYVDKVSDSVVVPEFFRRLEQKLKWLRETE